MKNAAVFLFCCTLMLTSCIKEKLSKQTTDISQTWEVTEKNVNGFNDISNFDAVYADYKIDFSSEGSYIESYAISGSSFSINGTWIFLNNGNEIKLIDNNRTRIFDIVELNSAVLTLELLGIPDKEIYYMEPI